MITIRSLVFSALGLAVATSAHARLGDTLTEATQRYGAATERSATVPATSSRSFTIGDLTIEADFINDSIHRLTYRRPRAFTEEEIQKLLAENAGTYSWLAESNRLNPLRDAIGQRVWLRSDRGSASLTRHTDGDKISESLVLTDAVWLMASLKLITAPKPATYRSLPLLDTRAPRLAQLRAGVDFIEQEQRQHPVYVHCPLGHGRSACFVLAWLVQTRRAPTVTAGLKLLRRLRPGVGLNPEQYATLTEFAADL